MEAEAETGKDCRWKTEIMSLRKILPAVSVALQDGDRLLLVRRGRAPSLG